MFKRSIKASAVWFAVLPTLVTASLIAIFLLIHINQLHKTALSEQAHQLSESLAFISENHLLEETPLALTHHLRAVQSSSSLSLKKIAIYKKNGHLFTTTKKENTSPIFTPKELKQKIYQSFVNNEKLYVSRLIFDNTVSNIESFDNDKVLGYVYVEVDTSSHLYENQSVTLATIVMIIIGVFATGILMLELIRKIVNPIISIVQTIQEIGSGKLTARVAIPVQHELNDLKLGVNMMAAELQENQEKWELEIENATQDLQQNLQLVEEKNAQLDITRKEALEASNIKSQFMATMSHEIRTPLNAISGFTKELNKGDLQAPYADYVETINASADNLIAIVNDILDFSKIEAGKIELDNSAFNLSQAVEDVANLLSPDAFNKGLIFIVESDRLPDLVIGDQHRFKQILNNLISNAIKFTQNGSVSLRFSLVCQSNTQCDLTIQVEDTGIGISESQQAKLFTAFNQAENSTSRRFGGTGLGLVITQGLVKQMAGKLKLTSVIDKGSIFEVKLPITTIHKPDAIKRYPNLETVLVLDHCSSMQLAYEKLFQQVNVLADVYTDISSWENALDQKRDYNLIIISGDSDEESIELLPLQAAYANKLSPNSKVALSVPTISNLNAEQQASIQRWDTLEQPLSLLKLEGFWQKHIEQQEELQPSTEDSDKDSIYPIRMLAVDDNKTNLQLLSAILSGEQIDLTTSLSGQDACELCEQDNFDLILMDVQMPVMDGVQATQLIRQGTLNKDTPIIAFTAHAFKDERDMLLRRGMDDYLAKPIDHAKFNALVKKWVNRDHCINHPARTYQSQQKSGIDWTLSLQMSGNRHAVAVEMLTMLVNTFDEVSKEMLAARNKRNNKELLNVVHKFHGATCYIGVPQLKNLASTIETQLKKSVVVDLDEQIEQLIEEMAQIRSDLEQINKKTYA